MTTTLPGIQVTCRCAWHDGNFLCGAPAPYLVNGTSYCDAHAADIVPRRLTAQYQSNLYGQDSVIH